MADEKALKHEPPAQLEQRAQSQQFKGRKKRTPFEQAEYFYNLRRTNILFFVSSLLLLLGFAAMVWDDYSRDWKEYQRVLQDMEISKLSVEMGRFRVEVDAKKPALDALDAQIAAVEKTLDDAREIDVPQTDSLTGQEKRDAQGAVVTERLTVRKSELVNELAALESQHYSLTQHFNFAQADYMTIRWEYEESLHHLEEGRRSGSLDLGPMERKYTAAKKKWDGVLATREVFQRQFQEIDLKKKRLQKLLYVLHEPLETLKAEKAKHLKELQTRERRFEMERPKLTNTVRDLPLLDFFGPTLKIEQVILPGIKENLNFEVKVDKVDRCHTCHARIGNPDYVVDQVEGGLFQFRNAELSAFVDHARGRTSGECGVCSGAKGEKRELHVAHGAWSEDDERRYVGALRAHPQLDLYVKDDSKHPISRFGCTVCHGGDGRDTEFSRVVHTPNNERQALDWQRRNKYHHRELWDIPMLPTQYSYAACRKCHIDDVEIPGASETYDEAKRLFERAGCYACHRTDTYQVQPKDQNKPETPIHRKMRRPGPPLTHLADKLTPGWATRWILDPKAFRLTTRMPRFFGQLNARTLHDAYNVESGKVEKLATAFEPAAVDEAVSASMVHYLFTRSQTRNYAAPPALAGDVERGKKLFQVGCMACHSVKPDEEYVRREGKRNDDDVYRAPDGTSWYLDEFAPNLSGVGSKVNPTWLYHWLKNPQHYFADTRMPSLRLSDQEAQDMAAYLMSLKKPGAEVPAELPSTDTRLLQHLIFELLSKQMTFHEAQQEIGRMTKEGGDSLRSYLGRRMVSNFGCFSCHEMEKDQISGNDWRNTEGIGVEFSGNEPIGGKALFKFDFGFTHWDGGVNYRGVEFNHGATGKPYHQFDQSALLNEASNKVRVPHNRSDWIFNKIVDPRVYDGGKTETKPPDELLRMPNFYFNAREARLLTMYLLSFTEDVPHHLVEHVERPFDEDHATLQRGLRLVVENNCRSCHRFSLDRFEFEYKRNEPGPDGKPKEKISIDTLEGKLKELSDDNRESRAEDLGLEEGDYERLLGVEWAFDPHTLKMHPAVEGKISYVIKKGGRWFLAVEGEKQWIEPRRHIPAEGGDVLPLIEVLSSTPETQKEGHYPPMLRSQGAKTQPEWLFDFLKNPTVVRPNLAKLPGVNIRMPTFGFTDEEAEALVKFFHIRDAGTGEAERLHHLRIEEREPGYLAMGSERMMTNVVPTIRKVCLECHSVGGALPGVAAGGESKFGPELYDVYKRLRPRWLDAWVRNPKAVYPDTIMTDPSLDEQGYRDIVDWLMNADRYPLPAAKP